MRYLSMSGTGDLLAQRSRRMRARVFVTLLGVAVFAILLAACGSIAQGQPGKPPAHTPIALAPSPTPTFTSVPTPTPPSTPTPSPTPVSTAVPTAIPQPTSPPLAPPILDVRPSSMSIVGHLDCTKTTVYVCQAAVVALASNQRALRWTTATSVPGRVGFSPASGTLAPGQSLIITITVPFTDCTPGLFSFHGPANTHTISWAC